MNKLGIFKKKYIVRIRAILSIPLVFQNNEGLHYILSLSTYVQVTQC